MFAQTVVIVPEATRVLSTSHTLLQRACRLEPPAWERLCALYGPIVHGWCRRSGLQESDAADAVQEVFRAVFLNLGEFLRQGGVFHAWLWTITANQVRLQFRRREHQRATELGSQDRELPDPVQPPSDEGEPDAETTRQRVVRRALDLVRGDFAVPTWQCFVRTTMQGESCQEVAAALGMNANAVRQARFRVLRRLRHELDGLL
jgi:RNA polymerase sigma-70 factor (ECF subfamily)